MPSELVAQGSDASEPCVTIAIPTFRRLDLLVQTVNSALAQEFDRPFEVVIVDNDPPRGTADALLERVPAIRQRNFRYYVNRENVGIFPNHNRAIQLARGEWVTILNDDDMLDPNYLALMFEELERDASIDGLVSGKRVLDERPSKPGEAGGPVRRAVLNALQLFKYGRSPSRRIDARKMFWQPGGVVGTPLGFIFRKRAALAIGGFDPENGMAADYWFYARFADRFHLRQHRAAAATLRIGFNETMKESTLKDHLVQTYRLHQALTSGPLPSWWMRFSPLVLARAAASVRGSFGAEVSMDEVGKSIDRPVGRDRPRLFKAVRLLLRGY